MDRKEIIKQIHCIRDIIGEKINRYNPLLENTMIKKYLKDDHIIDRSDESIRTLEFMLWFRTLYDNNMLKEKASEELIFKFAENVDCYMNYLVDIVNYYTDEKIKTYDFYHKLVTEYCYPLQEVDESFRDYNMCASAAVVFNDCNFNSNYIYRHVIESVPKEIMDKNLVNLLLHVLDNSDEDVAINIEYLNPLITYIPEKIINKRIVDICFKHDIETYLYIDDKYKTKKMLRRIVNGNPRWFPINEYILCAPKEHISHSIFLDIMKNDYYILEFKDYCDLLNYCPDDIKDVRAYRAFIKAIKRNFDLCEIVDGVDIKTKLNEIVPDDIKVQLKENGIKQIFIM